MAMPMNPFFQMDPATAASIYSGYGNQAQRGYSQQLAMTPDIVQNGLQELARSRQQNAQFIAQLRAEQEAQRQRAALASSGQFMDTLMNTQRLAQSQRESEADRQLRESLATKELSQRKTEGDADRTNRMMVAMIGANRGDKNKDPFAKWQEHMAAIQQISNDPPSRDFIGGMGINMNDVLKGMTYDAMGISQPRDSDSLLPPDFSKIAQKYVAGMPMTDSERGMLERGAPMVPGLSKDEIAKLDTTPVGRGLVGTLQPIYEQWKVAAKPQEKEKIKKRVLETIDPYFDQLNKSEQRDILSQFLINREDLTVYRFEKQMAEDRADAESRAMQELWEAIFSHPPVRPRPLEVPQENP